MENLLIAGPIVSFGHLKFQPTYKHENGIINLNSVNIIHEDQIWVKIRQEDTNLEYRVENAEKIAVDFILSKLGQPEQKKKPTKKEARKNAANDLMKMFDL